jgi:hypothetical protein
MRVTARHQALADLLAAASAPVRSGTIEASGISPQTIKEAVALGLADQVARGWYLLPNRVPDNLRAYLEVALRYPKAVFILQSAAWFNGLIADEAHAGIIYLALPRSQGIPGGYTYHVGGRCVRTRLHADSKVGWGTRTVLVAGHPLTVTDEARTVAELCGNDLAVILGTFDKAMATYLPTGTRLEPMIAAIRLGLPETRRASLLASD